MQFILTLQNHKQLDIGLMLQNVYMKENHLNIYININKDSLEDHASVVTLVCDGTLDVEGGS